MEQSGEYRIEASREDVWLALNDPHVLGACIEGCQNIEKIDDTHFEVTVKAKIGPVSATFDAQLALSDMVPPDSYVINGSAKGGVAGFAKGSASVGLTEEQGMTILRYDVKANVGGKLAQIGSRLVDGAARKMADDFFAQFSARLDPSAQASAVDESPATIEAEAATDEDPHAQEEQSAEPEQPTERVYEKSDGWQMWIIAFVALGIAAILAI